MSLTSHTENSTTVSADRQGKPSLYDAVLGQANSLNFIRFVLASLVIVAHSAPLVKYNAGILGIPAPAVIDSLGHWAVYLFFCISGFLIAHSAQRGTAIGYLKRRTMRIFPGYWVSLLFVVFICGPISVATGHTSEPFSLKSAAGYILRNFDLNNRQLAFLGGPTGIPWPGIWNGSTWTLKYEFLAYLALIPIFYISFMRKRSKWLVPVIFVVLFCLIHFFHFSGYTPNIFVNNSLRLSMYFFAGTLLYVWGKRVTYSAPLGIALIAVSFVATLFWEATTMSYLPLPTAYGVLALSAAIKTRWCSKNDISYGVYIYAFPVQILLVIFGSASLGWVLNAILTFAITVGLAWLSWLYIEKPSLALKNRKILPIRRNRSTDAVAVSS